MIWYYRCVTIRYPRHPPAYQTPTGQESNGTSLGSLGPPGGDPCHWQLRAPRCTWPLGTWQLVHHVAPCGLLCWTPHGCSKTVLFIRWGGFSAGHLCARSRQRGIPEREG